jgi:hypothetical protein
MIAALSLAQPFTAGQQEPINEGILAFWRRDAGGWSPGDALLQSTLDAWFSGRQVTPTTALAAVPVQIGPAWGVVTIVDRNAVPL